MNISTIAVDANTTCQQIISQSRELILLAKVKINFRSESMWRMGLQRRGNSHRKMPGLSREPSDLKNFEKKPRLNLANYEQLQ